MTLEQIKSLIKDVPNFPKQGIVFKDITPVLENADAFHALSKKLAEYVPAEANKIIAIESRGFILGAAVAQHTNCGMVIVRKPGKLPRETVRQTYDLEYGTDTLEMHKDSIRKGDRVVILDDVLATGGTASAVENLCEKLGAQVLGSVFLMEIAFCAGRNKLRYPSQSLLTV